MPIKSFAYKFRSCLVFFCVAAIFAGQVYAEQNDTVEVQAAPALVEQPADDELSQLSAVNGVRDTVKLGSVQKDTGYKFEVELTTRGAGIARATLSEFDSRDQDNPAPLDLLLEENASELILLKKNLVIESDYYLTKQIYQFEREANTLIFVDAKEEHVFEKVYGKSQKLEIKESHEKRQKISESSKVYQFKLIRSLCTNLIEIKNIEDGFTEKGLRIWDLDWSLADKINENEVRFETTIFGLSEQNKPDRPVVKLSKTYTIQPDSYDVVCELRIENLTDRNVKASIDMQGPAGMTREAVRNDMRSLAAAFITDKGVKVVKKDNNDLRKATKATKADDREKLQITHKDAAAKFVWAAMTNKYFAAILRPVPQVGEFPVETSLGKGQYYDPGILQKKPSGEENSSFSINTIAAELAPASEQGNAKTFRYELYLGPKSKDVFKNNETYKKLEYFQTIDFRTCCCPQSVIAPLAFGIMSLMKILYGIIPNYGVAIIIIVFLVRLAMHPVTKKSQVSMMRMQKLGPKIQEIQKKYANNKAEMNKHVMAMYKEQGVSPLLSFLPMMLQMPIWIALWTAIYASVDLRGAAFLPVWITDLSAPDALISFNAITIPVVNWTIDSFNLLPILMGVVMYLQQKMMPQSAQAQTNPQMAQQQKMMMIMMPLMFPLMLYKGPSGVNLYIMTSIGAGVIEQAVIRKHIREKDAAESQTLVSVTSKTGGKVKKKKPKPFYRDH